MPQSSILRTLFVLLLVAGPSQAQWHRHWFQEEQSLTLDARHLALRCEDEMSGRAALNALGHDDCSLERWPVPGWWLVTFTDTPPGDADLRALVQALSLRSEISFAAPVFVGLDGGQVWPTDEILARCASQRSNDATAASL
ncbi:MAG: hypothetical protein KDB53_20605, partial [Planctomycetes bacterium]|nr:hypothetical protein [Planctomycetota bacterium]